MKSKAAIEQMINNIEDELASLPDFNVFGDSNEEAKQESQEWIDALNCALNDEPYNNEEVEAWVQEKGYSALTDYE